MKQLVELGKKADEFKKSKTEVIAVFREEKKGEDGLKAIKDKTKTPFTLALDNGNKHTGRYSSGRREFTGYVINPEGKVTKILKGDLRNRAKADELLKAINGSSEAGSGAKGAGAKASSTTGSGSKTSSGGSKSKGSGRK